MLGICVIMTVTAVHHVPPQQGLRLVRDHGDFLCSYSMVPWLRRADSVRPDTGVAPKRPLSLPEPRTASSAGAQRHARSVHFFSPERRTCTLDRPRTGATPHDGRRPPCAGPPPLHRRVRSKSSGPDGSSGRIPSLACPRTAPAQLQRAFRAPLVRSVAASTPASRPARGQGGGNAPAYSCESVLAFDPASEPNGTATAWSRACAHAHGPDSRYANPIAGCFPECHTFFLRNHRAGSTRRRCIGRHGPQTPAMLRSCLPWTNRPARSRCLCTRMPRHAAVRNPC